MRRAQLPVGMDRAQAPSFSSVIPARGAVGRAAPSRSGCLRCVGEAFGVAGVIGQDFPGAIARRQMQQNTFAPSSAR